MEVRLSPERARFVRRCVNEARYATPEDAVDAALVLLEREGVPLAVRQAISRGLEQAAAGQCGPATADDVVRRVG